MRDYLRELEGALGELGVTCRIFSTKSNGGVMSAARAAERPVETLLSGPASGVIGSAYLGQLIGERRLVRMTDVNLVRSPRRCPIKCRRLATVKLRFSWCPYRI